VELLSLEGDLANDTDPNVYIRRLVLFFLPFPRSFVLYSNVCLRCPLYVEPKKIYVNLMYGDMCRETFPSAEEIVKINKFVRIIRMLSELSHKMIRSISKGTRIRHRTHQTHTRKDVLRKIQLRAKHTLHTQRVQTQRNHQI
jgi:hypothetical protein